MNKCTRFLSLNIKKRVERLNISVSLRRAAATIPRETHTKNCLMYFRSSRRYYEMRPGRSLNAHIPRENGDKF